MTTRVAASPAPRSTALRRGDRGRARPKTGRLVAHRREQDDLADRVRAGEQHDQAVDPQTHPTGRRHPLLERLDVGLVVGLNLLGAALLQLACASKRSRCTSGSFSSVKALAISMPPANASQRSTSPGSERWARANGDSSTG